MGIIPRPWQRDWPDPSLPRRICLYRNSQGDIYACEPGNNYPDIYVPESEILALRQQVAMLTPLAKLGLNALEHARWYSDFDPMEVMELAEKHGVVVSMPVQATPQDCSNDHYHDTTETLKARGLLND